MFCVLSLTPVEQTQLLELLMEFEDLFDGTLGDWKTEPVLFELKECSKPYHNELNQLLKSIIQL